MTTMVEWMLMYKVLAIKLKRSAGLHWHWKVWIASSRQVLVRRNIQKKIDGLCGQDCYFFAIFSWKLDFESCLVPCKESERYLSHTASQGDFMVFHSENGEQGKHAPISKVFCLFNFNHRHCLGPVDVGKAAVHHRKPPFFALGSKKLLVWLPAPVREFSQSGATEGRKAWATTFEGWMGMFIGIGQAWNGPHLGKATQVLW